MVLSAAEAVQALTDAKDDVSSLQRAVEQASFLDETPGNARQKLRGAWTGGVRQRMGFGKAVMETGNIAATIDSTGPFALPRTLPCGSAAARKHLRELHKAQAERKAEQDSAAEARKSPWAKEVRQEQALSRPGGGPQAVIPS